MTDLPFENNTFEFVLAYNVIYHAYKHDIKKTIKEIFRVLKHNGYLFVTILTKDY